MTHSATIYALTNGTDCMCARFTNGRAFERGLAVKLIVIFVCADEDNVSTRAMRAGNTPRAAVTET